MSLHVKKGDRVKVISGKDKGVVSEIIAVDTETQRVTVEGVGRVTRHVKPGPRGTGGLVTQESPLHVSNVAVVDPEDKKPTRIKTRVEQVDRDGRTKTTRVRVAARSGKDI